MELTYNITERDFVDFNLHFARNDKAIQAQIRRTQIFLTAMVLVGGIMLMLVLNALSLWSALVYIFLAVAAYFYVPRSSESQIKKNVARVLRQSNNKHICGEKTMTLTEKGLTLKGVNENSSYKYKAIKKVCAAENQVFIYLDDVTGLIVPNSAFADEAKKQEFIRYIEERISA